MIRTTLAAVAVSLAGAALNALSFLAGWNLAKLLARKAEETKLF